MLGKLGHSIGPILKSFSINPSGGSVSRAATMASFAVTLLLRRVPSLRGARALSVALPWRWYSSLSRDSDSDSTVAFSYGSESGSDESSTPLREKEIMKDIEPIRTLAKDILHSKRYRDGESLNAEDEKEITEKILHYHPHSEDKIGCGLSSIVVDRHPEFRYSRCLFVARTDGDLVDFSYNKCLKTYIRSKYPSHAEWFIRKHFGRK
ncbi:protein DCL homolog, chloroplastic-like [Zingiber officinale]|uniref:protein DCL homolog, chloroplastic-like n=1 Tax=Zingiber officinale TaxID=94328 RepID=UPI001C4C16DB|nr:protein DCL homolog, chloroplastic-like [Zingiber officinale]